MLLLGKHMYRRHYKFANEYVKLLEGKDEIIDCVFKSLSMCLKKDKKTTWVRINVSSLCPFVLHIAKTHHLVHTVQMVALKR